MVGEKKDFYEPIHKECVHKDECSSYPAKCGKCKNNPDNGKDYYEPNPWPPYKPRNPWPPYTPWKPVWCQSRPPWKDDKNSKC